jgi:hypothetical protein
VGEGFHNRSALWGDTISLRRGKAFSMRSSRFSTQVSYCRVSGLPRGPGLGLAQLAAAFGAAQRI